MEGYEEIRDVVEQLTGSGGGEGPALIDLIVSNEPVTETTRAMVGMDDAEDMIVVPYYDNVPRAYYRERGKADKNGLNGR